MKAKPLLTEKNIEELADPSLGGAYDLEQINRMALIASICIHQSPAERPQMSQVVRMLKGDEGILQSKKKFQKRPAFKRTCSVDLSEDEEYNSPQQLNDLNQQNQIALEL
ncbi:unnamed protein product [Ilex paraguariensis]|uniref:Uncharacterized protein n=1 Tax=Ilex paraguariensis TaxID=185542 RepID=A0ABC8SXZ7_9AQUA